MRHAKLSTSRRLQAVLRALEVHPRGLTTYELTLHTGGCAIHSDIAELRANGVQISCAYQGKSAAGRRVYRYTLESPKRKVA